MLGILAQQEDQYEISHAKYVLGRKLISEHVVSKERHSNIIEYLKLDRQ